MKRNACIFCSMALLSFMLLPLTALGDAKQQIESHFQQKLFFIRGFYRNNHLSYDDQGNVKGEPKTGPWSLALLRVEQVSVDSDKFILEGTRAAAVYNSANKKFNDTIPAQPERIEITVEYPTEALTDSALDALTNKIFLTRLTPEDAPDWWHDFLSGNRRELGALGPGTPVPVRTSDGQPVYRPMFAGVTAPRVLLNPDPKYEAIARKSKLQGTSVLAVIVNKEGLPEQIQVSRPLGMGLDDMAVQTVSKWRFEPATLNGEPVAVFIQVEINFRLF